MCFILKKKFPVYICSILQTWSRGVSGCGSLAWLLCTELSERTHHLHARAGFSPLCQTRCRAWLLLLLPGVSSIEKLRECNSACDQLGRRQPRENSWEEFRGGKTERKLNSFPVHFISHRVDGEWLLAPLQSPDDLLKIVNGKQLFPSRLMLLL